MTDRRIDARTRELLVHMLDRKRRHELRLAGERMRLEGGELRGLGPPLPEHVPMWLAAAAATLSINSEASWERAKAKLLERLTPEEAGALPGHSYSDVQAERRRRRLL
jgi:hypothetical protein